MKIKYFTLLLVVFFSICSLPLLANEEKPGHETIYEGKHSYVPDGGYVPDAETALKIAEAVLIPIYGKETIDNEKPFEAELKGDIWYVSGRLPEGLLGGVAEIEINKNDGKILRVTHGK